MSILDWSILWPACLAGLIVTTIHVPLGVQVLDRGIVFIDLAIAQIAGVGVVIGHFAGFEASWSVQVCALGAAGVGALALTWTERRFAEAQEAIIGVSFVLAACTTLLLLARDPHGGEHLKELLVGQILWIDAAQLIAVGSVYAALLAGIAMRPRILRQRLVFYLAFAVVVTLSVQLIGLYLVFASLVVPALATHWRTRHRLPHAYAISLLGYAVGILVSALADLPTGPVIVYAMIACGVLDFAAARLALII
jgi:zinc/manganese transport system permease protein